MTKLVTCALNWQFQKEHVPPICLFPEEKDIKTSMFRKNLITVPSCELHNSKKSKDDEFLMACLASIVGNNFLGYFHTHKKVKRALLKKGKAFLSIISICKQTLHLNADEGLVIKLVMNRCV